MAALRFAVSLRKSRHLPSGVALANAFLALLKARRGKVCSAAHVCRPSVSATPQIGGVASGNIMQLLLLYRNSTRLAIDGIITKFFAIEVNGREVC